MWPKAPKSEIRKGVAHQSTGNAINPALEKNNSCIVTLQPKTWGGSVASNSSRPGMTQSSGASCAAAHPLPPLSANPTGSVPGHQQEMLA